MSTEKESRKIKDVIDEVNSLWGEEHEEKRKKIYKSNIILTPFKDFIFVSFVYMTSLAICVMLLGTGGDAQSIAEFAKLIFNAPYYLIDLRSGIIASLASILLSLYVSVGKFGEGLEGGIGESRRAAYRNFARFVGGIVSFILVINFWHGLVAGYLNGTSYAPELFGPWRVGPGWGKSIISEDVNLSRYGEVPLWALLFFAWFTAASSRMLTYNEKDVLVRNSVVIQRAVGSLGANNSTMHELYNRVLDFIDRHDEIPKIRAKAPKNPSEYADRFISSVDYQGFEFVLMKENYKELIRLLPFRRLIAGFIFLWPLVWIVLWIFGALGDGRLVMIFFMCAGSSVASLILKIVVALNNNSIFYQDIYKFSIKKLGDWWGSYGVESIVVWYVNFVIFGLIIPFISYGSIYFLASLRQDSDVNVINQVFAVSIIFIFVTYVFLCHCVYSWITGKLRLVFFQALKEHSEKYLMKFDEEKLSKDSQIAKINKDEFYLLFSYIYCSVLRVNEYYSEYKSEIGAAESKVAGDTKTSKKSKKSRKAPRHK